MSSQPMISLGGVTSSKGCWSNVVDRSLSGGLCGEHDTAGTETRVVMV